MTYFPDLEDYKMGPEGYLGHIRRAKEPPASPSSPSSTACRPRLGRVPREMPQAGADAVELNVYYVPTNPNMTGAQVEDMYVDLVKTVKAAVTVPVAVKIGPYFSSMANMARRLSEAGADALVMFNRFYQPDLDLAKLEVKPDLVLSDSAALRLRLRGWPSSSATSRRTWRHRRRPHRRRRAQVHDGRRQGRHDDLGPPEARPGHLRVMLEAWRSGWTRTSTARSPRCRAP
jgi:hypothetical protein